MLILANAKIHTLDPKQPIASALVVDSAPDNMGRVLALGSLEDLKERFSSAKIEDLRGGVILPGLTDAHIHFRQYSLGLQQINCDASTRAECLERVRARALHLAPGTWIRGHGWRQNNWPEGFGTAAMLDKVAPKNPVYLTAASLHAGWANSAALKTANITTETDNPVNGEIQRDEEARPTGILFEAAMEMVTRVMPQSSAEEDVEVMRAAQKHLWSL